VLSLFVSCSQFKAYTGAQSIAGNEEGIKEVKKRRG